MGWALACLIAGALVCAALVARDAMQDVDLPRMEIRR
jgi:hypothetical protein